MPIAFDPNERVIITLKSHDLTRPPEKRPKFSSRALSKRDRREVGRLVDQARAAADESERDALLLKAFQIGDVSPIDAQDREGNPLPQSAESIDAVLSDVDVWELANDYPYLVGLSEADRKKSLLAAASTSEQTASAPNVGQPGNA